MSTVHLYNRVFVWEVPVRLFHWVNALCILVLSATGYLIGDPPAIMSAAEATNAYWFGVVRFIHFAAAYIFIAFFIYRIAWMFLGNKYASWKVFLPFHAMGFKKILFVIKEHILLQNSKVYDFRHNFIGHNPVASLSYLGVFILMILQIITGFALYDDMATWWLPKMFGWVIPLFGGDLNVRFWHHIIMWLFVIFSVIHIYLAFWHDWLEGRGEISSIIAGYKFCRKERYDEKKKEAGLGVEELDSDIDLEDLTEK
ncbi:MAG: Ni/Fe-hydrogenase, b-type cytochrome subunit [Bacteroidota bacterium]